MTTEALTTTSSAPVGREHQEAPAARDPRQAEPAVDPGAAQVAPPATAVDGAASDPLAPADPRAERLGSVVWTLADQVVSSATNAAVSFLVARQVGVGEFGSFALAFVAFAFMIGTSKALVMEPLMIRLAGASPALRQRGVSAATGATVVVGLVAGLLVGGLGATVDGLTGSVLLVMAVLLPGLLLQDAWRQAFFAAQRPQAALVNDLVWAVLQIGGMVLVSRSDRGGVLELVAVWGLAACVAAALGCLQARVLPRPLRGIAWLVEQRDLGVRLALDFAINQGAVYVAVISIGGILGLAAVGAIRGAHVLIAPVYVGYFAFASFALPMLSRRASDAGAVRRGAALVSLIAGSLASAWALTLLVLPRALGQELLGDSWLGARTMLPFTGLQCAAIGVAIGASLGLKARAQASTVLRLTLLQAPLLLVLGISGAWLFGGRGAVAGFAMAQVIGAAANWFALLSVLRVRGAHRIGRARTALSGPASGSGRPSASSGAGGSGRWGGSSGGTHRWGSIAD